MLPNAKRCCSVPTSSRTSPRKPERKSKPTPVLAAPFAPARRIKNRLLAVVLITARLVSRRFLLPVLPKSSKHSVSRPRPLRNSRLPSCSPSATSLCVSRVRSSVVTSSRAQDTRLSTTTVLLLSPKVSRRPARRKRTSSSSVRPMTSMLLMHRRLGRN